MLAGVLWGDNPTPQSKKYLRQALWQLNSGLESQLGAISRRILEVEPEWINLNSNAHVWLDVAEFERAYAGVQGATGQDLDSQTAHTLQAAVRLYAGELLEGYYQDWCVYERERLQNMHLAILDKLMSYCEAHRLYEDGLSYGASVLRCDRARERTHRRIMRLHYLAGDRTAALRQYATCVAALQDELHIAPSETTLALYEQIRGDRVAPAPPMATQAEPVPSPSSLPAVLAHLKQLQAALTSFQNQMQHDIQNIEHLLDEEP